MRPCVQLKHRFSGACVILALTAWILLPQAIAIGQSSGEPAKATGSQHSARHRYRRPSIDDQVKAMAKNLDLNEAQQGQVKGILERRQEQARRIRTDPALSGSDRINKYRGVDGGAIMQIRSVLNDEQKKKYDPLAHRQSQPSSPQPSVEDWMKAASRSKPSH